MNMTKVVNLPFLFKTDKHIEKSAWKNFADKLNQRKKNLLIHLSILAFLKVTRIRNK